MREIRTLGAMRRGLETDSRFGYRGTPRGNGEQQLGWTFGIPRQSSTRPASFTNPVHLDITGFSDKCPQSRVLSEFPDRSMAGKLPETPI